jgi:hypothetical protein
MLLVRNVLLLACIGAVHLAPISSVAIALGDTEYLVIEGRKVRPARLFESAKAALEVGVVGCGGEVFEVRLVPVKRAPQVA